MPIHHHTKQPTVLVISGVTACGKSTIGKLLAERLFAQFLDADNFHTQENIDKMSKGIALHDDDRLEWLQHLQSLVKSHTENGKPMVLACSALKAKYRDIIAGTIHTYDEKLPTQPSEPKGIAFIHLNVDLDELKSRLAHRKNHFMKASLLQSQLDDWEDVSEKEEQIGGYDGYVIDANKNASETVDAIIKELNLHPF
eukprot:TRINITY_DN18805_c0_g1_i1.p1 TRINITY_DN18805_c0_g1~~TRINITY_DN18805_c0_g1_i1.p1  ORF type:complete len:198 (-),score=33.39 TRINITY_DN18805_c0_g1_i1:89-682(-)